MVDRRSNSKRSCAHLSGCRSGLGSGNAASTTEVRRCTRTGWMSSRRVRASVSCISAPVPAIIRRFSATKVRLRRLSLMPRSPHALREIWPIGSNVACIKGNGFDWPRGAVDVVYVNFAASRPARSWVENLNVGGRLVFPLGVPRAATPMIGQVSTPLRCW